jgi:hypothetical protein
VAFGSSAVLGSFVASGCGVAEGGEDPWLCGSDFRRVCLCRGEASRAYASVQETSMEAEELSTLYSAFSLSFQVPRRAFPASRAGSGAALPRG